MGIKTPVRAYRGKGHYTYITKIGDFQVKGETENWNVFRDNKLIANVELLGEAEYLIDVVIKQATT